MTPQQYCLRWKHHHTNVQSMFAQLLEKERFCDVTLYCSPSFAGTTADAEAAQTPTNRGVSLRAHRVVLAACSELLGTLLGAHEAQGEPVLVIDGAEPKHVRALLDYMYTGEMNVHHSQLPSLLKTAEELRIKGLTDIRWNNKDEPPDDGGSVTATQIKKLPLTPERKTTTTPDPKVTPEPKVTPDRKVTPERKVTPDVKRSGTPDASDDDGSENEKERFGVNGGPPPLIKLPLREKDKTTSTKRDLSDTESQSPKRQRLISANEHTDDDSRSQTKSEIQEQDWQPGNMDITAERISSWGVSGEVGCVDWSRDSSGDEWADAPADIGSFLHTRLKVDGDNSADDSNEEPHAASSCSSAGATDLKGEAVSGGVSKLLTVGPKSGPSDPRFMDVVKLNDYLQHGRRPQFWEENYVKRVMEAVRMKELEMKQAAEILGVSYGTLYGRYRDVYGCINRPYRTDRGFWCHKGPAEVLERLTRGEMSLDAAALALGVNPNQLMGYIAELQPDKKEMEPIPIELDPLLKPPVKVATRPQASPPPSVAYLKNLRKLVTKKVVVSSAADEDSIPATVISAVSDKFTTNTSNNSGKWPSIRVASLDTLRATSPATATALMKARPDLTIVPAKSSDP